VTFEGTVDWHFNSLGKQPNTPRGLHRLKNLEFVPGRYASARSPTTKNIPDIPSLKLTN